MFGICPSRPVRITPLTQVQHVVPEVTIPPEVTPENVTTCIIDSSCTSTPFEGILAAL